MHEYYHFFVDAWRFFRRFYQSAEDTDEWWDKMISESSGLTKKYGERRFAMDVVMAIANELERKVKSGNV